MVNDPREMFEHYADLTKMYDFDLISRQQKAEFIEMVFSRQRNVAKFVLEGRVRDCFLKMLEETYRDKREKIISCLDGKLNFYGFKSYFCSFYRDDQVLVCSFLKEKMDEVTVFKKYEDYQRLSIKEVQFLRNYACRQLNGWTPNREFYQAVYDDCNNP